MKGYETMNEQLFEMLSQYFHFVYPSRKKQSNHVMNLLARTHSMFLLIKRNSSQQAEQMRRQAWLLLGDFPPLPPDQLVRIFLTTQQTFSNLDLEKNIDALQAAMKPIIQHSEQTELLDAIYQLSIHWGIVYTNGRRQDKGLPEIKPKNEWFLC